MSPLLGSAQTLGARFPRVSGDEPGAITVATRDPAFSPRERG